MSTPIFALAIASTAVAQNVVSPIYDMPNWPKTAEWEKTEQQLQGVLDVSNRTLQYNTLGVDGGADVHFSIEFTEDQVRCFQWACILQTPTADLYGAQVAVYGIEMDTDPHGFWFWTMRAWDARVDYAIATAGGGFGNAEPVPEPSAAHVALLAVVALSFFGRKRNHGKRQRIGTSPKEARLCSV